jgi:hypothetical protein
MNRAAVAFVVLGFATLAPGCYPPILNFTPSSSVPSRPAKSPDAVDIVFKPDEPKCKYRIVGEYDVKAFHSDTAGGKRLIREDAASRGFDGIMNMECGAPGTVGEANGACSGRAYLCE